MKINELHLLSDIYKKNPASLQQEMYKLLDLGINISNMYQELEMSSHYVDTHMDISFGNIPINFHSHSYYEIMYVLSNSGCQYLVGTQRYNLQRGDIIMIPPGIGHKPLFPVELAEPYRRIVLWINTDFVENIKSSFPDSTRPLLEQEFLLRTAGTPWESIGKYFQQGLKEAQEKNDYWQISLCGNTMQLLIQCVRAMCDSQKAHLKSEKPELLDDVVSYIESHLGQKITLADTAQRFYVSENTIGLTFQKKMHVSFYHYVTQRRLIAAKSLMLKERNLDIISEKVGFSDYSTFYRAFKKEFGISPREYRNLIADSL